MTDQDRIGDPHGRRGYDPNQPRVPAGQSMGGQWSDTDRNGAGADPSRKFVRDTTGEETWNFFFNTFRPDGSLAEQVVFNRDRSRIVSEFNGPGGGEDWDERHTVIAPDGSKFTFETAGDTQTVYDGEGRPISKAVWTENGPESLPSAQPVFFPLAAAPAVGAGVGIGTGEATGLAVAGLALFTWLSSRNSPNGTAVFAFKAVQYRKKERPNEDPEAVWVGRLTREQVDGACKKLKDVQDRTDEAVGQVRKEGKYDGPADFGTKVHKKIADGINLDPKRSPNYIAEISLAKSKEADEQRLQLAKDREGSKPKEGPHYGQRGTIRVDALENRPDVSTVCVYDPKTGERGLSLPRMKELAQTVQRNYPGTQHIIVTEVRPGRK